MPRAPQDPIRGIGLRPRLRRRANRAIAQHTTEAVTRVIRRLHIYLGLLCSAYLVVFGLSSLSLNHPGSWLDSEPLGEDRETAEEIVNATTSNYYALFVKLAAKLEAQVLDNE